MSKLAYFAHSLRSDWNNGNAHFLRGLMRELIRLGHSVMVFEPAEGWSQSNLLTEPEGVRSLDDFQATYPDLDIQMYDLTDPEITAEMRRALQKTDVVIVHEWNDSTLIEMLLGLRQELGYRALFHDTHHRASSSPEAILRLRIHDYDGVLAFGDALTAIYKDRFGIAKCWTLHEAADTSVFYPRVAPFQDDLVWVGNWGDGERSAELREFLIGPASRVRAESPEFKATIYGVRYPEDGLAALAEAGIAYGGYLPNLQAPGVYARAAMTIHVPRQQYAGAMRGIPTIRVFEALASGIPLISAPWEDTEELFRPGDFVSVRDSGESVAAIRRLRSDEIFAQEQVERGLATVLARHTCAHRAAQLTGILEEVLSG